MLHIIGMICVQITNTGGELAHTVGRSEFLELELLTPSVEASDASGELNRYNQKWFSC